MSDHPFDKESGLASALIARDKQGLLGNVSMTVSGQAAGFAAGLVCTIVTARLLGPEGYGRLVLFFMFYTILAQIIVGWPNVGFVRFGREELGRDGAMSRTFWARILLFIPSFGIAALLVLFLRNRLGEYLGIGHAAALLLLYVGLNEAILLMRGVFQTAGRFRAYGLITFAMRALKLPAILLAFALLASRVGVVEIIAAHVVSVAIVAIGVALFLPWRQLLPVRAGGKALHRLIAYSWPFMLAGLSVLVVDWVDLAVIKHFRPAVELGQYAVAYQPITVMMHLCLAFVGAVLPLLVSLAVEQQHRTLTWYLDEALPQIAWVVGIACTLAAAAAEAIPLLLGRGYVQSVMPCQVLMAGMAFSVVAALQVALAQAMDRVRAAAIVMLVLAALNVGLDLLLVPRIGILGAGAATTAAFALSGLLYFPLLNAIPYLRGSAPRRRYATLLGLAPPLGFAAIAVTLKAPALRLMGCAAILVVSAGAAYGIGVFRMTTLDRLEKVRMPRPLRSMTRSFYRVFGRRAGEKIE